MKRCGLLIAVLSVLALATGCTLSKTDYANTQAALSGSKSLRDKAVVECKAKVARKSAADRRNMAALMNVSESQVGPVFCTRLVAAMANGRLTYDNFIAAAQKGDYTTLIKVLQKR